MQAQHHAETTTGSDERAAEPVGSHGLVLRNYDASGAHELSVRFLDASGTTFERTVRLGPLETASVRPRVERGVYRVVARLEDAEDSAECLVGDGVDETALVETGNGTVSVTDGFD